MKRELVFLLEAQCQFTCYLGRTRSSNAQPRTNYDLSTLVGNPIGSIKPGNEHHHGRNKRFKTPELDSKPLDVNESNVGIMGVEKGKNEGKIVLKKKVSATMGASRRFTRSTLKSMEKIAVLATGDVHENKGGAVAPMPVEGGRSERKMVVKEKMGVAIGGSRRFTRSALKSKVEGMGLTDGDSKLTPGDSLGATSGDVGVSGTLTKKLELKMSKKIALHRKPATVKELLETGLLEGHSVLYNNGKKENQLQGVIKGNGILCFCRLCLGSRVIPPSQFEIHAREAYKRAAQYICLENGKSLLQVLELCRRSSLEVLRQNFHSIIGHFPEKESTFCQNCQGSILICGSMDARQLCDPCQNSNSLQVDPTIPASENAGEEPVSVPEACASATLSTVTEDALETSRESKTNPSDQRFSLASPNNDFKCTLSTKTSQRNTKSLSRSSLIPKCSASVSLGITLPSKRKGGRLKRLSNSSSFMKSSRNGATCSSPQKKTWKITKKDQRMHWLVFGEGGLPDGSEVAYYSRGKKFLEGYKKGSGIFCFCCNSEVSASQFEAHAGWPSRKKPYGYIYTSNGVSLHEYAISLLKHRQRSSESNDDCCIICADGGNLLLCDGCPRAFHKECASLSNIPQGKWYCKFCETMFQREKCVERNENALAAGRVAGVDPIEQITNRCIRIIKNPEETEAIACQLCRGYDYSKSGFGLQTVMLCDQCEKEYHVHCLKRYEMADLKELPKGNWFCSIDCEKVHSMLKNLLICKPLKVPDILMDLIAKKQNGSGLDNVANFDVQWRLLNGEVDTCETRLLLSEAMAIFHECFDPIIDPASGHDFIPSLVYGKNITGQDFGGMYCALLTFNSAIVSVGMLRVFGREVAELPLVATSKSHQGKGYFQLLFSCIEKLLGFLRVEKIVLPAADEAESIWTSKFDFNKISLEQLLNYRKTYSQMIVFKGTSMLEKVVPQFQHFDPDATTFDLSIF